MSRLRYSSPSHQAIGYKIADNEPGSSAGAGAGCTEGTDTPGQFIFDLCSPRPDMWQRRGPGQWAAWHGPCDQSTGDTRGRHIMVSAPDIRGLRASLPAVCRCHSLLILSGKDVRGQPRHRHQEDQWHRHHRQWHSRHGYVWPCSVMTWPVLRDECRAFLCES